MTTVSTQRSLILHVGRLLFLTVAALVVATNVCSQLSLATAAVLDAVRDSQESASRGNGGQRQQQTGSISGKVVDQSGAEVPGANVRLTQDEGSPDRVATTDEYGLFAFTHVSPGPFQLTISSPGLSSQQFSGTVEPGQAFVTPLLMLVIPTQVTEVRVTPKNEELVQAQVKEQEKQRVFGVLPNFYVTYDPNPVPLTPKFKFELAWKSATDPITLVGVGVLAGLDQAGNRWSGYGQGAEGYAKRVGATYANVFGATFIGGAVMPTVLKQDPRYFYKGNGSRGSRILRAISSSVICKGDNGRWQPNYSNVIGSFAGAGLEAAYLPANDRRGSGFVISSALIRLGETSLAGVLQEFILPRFTPNHSTRSHR